MRKIAPADVWDDFAAQVDEQTAFFDRSWGMLANARDRKVATENYVLTVGVAFEGYVNDLIFAYANRDCRKVMEHLKASVEACLVPNPKAKAAFDKFADFRPRAHLTRAELKEILDPTGRNTSFPNCSAIEGRARQWLIDEHRARFIGLSAQQKAVIDVAIAFRNNLAHRSQSSLDRLNDVLQAGPLHATGLQRGANRVQAGNFLKAQANGERRADVLVRLLRSAAEDLVPERAA